MRLSISINDDLVQKIDEYAKSKYMSRSAFLALAADTYINQSNVMENLPALMKLYEQEYADNR
jgi:metal-responsive CopG/Arc/MetJ family transcriptional regulator